MALHTDELLGLNQVADSLLPRIAQVKQALRTASTRPKCLESVEYAPIRKALIRIFPDLSVTREKGFDQLQLSANACVAELEQAVKCFEDCYQLCRSALAVLQSVAGSVAYFHLHQNFAILYPFMDLWLNYVRIHLLLSDIEDRIVVLGIYGVCKTNMAPDALVNFKQVAEFILEMNDPFQTLYDQFQKNQTPIGELLKGTQYFLRNSLDLLRGNNQIKLNPLDLPATFAQCELNPMYWDAQNVDRHIQWILYGLLVCPDLLTIDAHHPDAANTASLVHTLLQEGFVLTVYQDQILYIHEHYENLMERLARTSTAKFSVTKASIREAEKVAVTTSPYMHQRSLASLNTTAQQLIDLVEECPGVVAPKLPVIMAVLGMLRYELAWAARHYANRPRRLGGIFTKSHVAEYKEEAFCHPLIVEAAGTCLALSSLVRRCLPVIQSYYTSYMTNAHTNSLRRLLQEAADMPAVSEGCGKLLNSIAARTAGCGTGAALEPLRLEWARVVMSMWTSANASFTKRALSNGPEQVLAFQELVVRCNLIYRHSQYVDGLNQLLVDTASLNDLYWWWDSLLSQFETLVRGQAIILPRNTLRCVEVCAHALHCAKRWTPDARERLGRSAAAMAERMMATICDAVWSLINTATELEGRLQTVADMQSRDLKKATETKREEGKADADEVEDEDDGGLRPGSESHASARFRDRAIHNLHVVSCVLTALCRGIQAAPIFRVFDKELNLQQAVRDKIRSEFESFLRTTVGREHMDDCVRLIRLRYHVILRVHSLGLPVRHDVNEVLLRERALDVVGPLGSPVAIRPAGIGEDNMAARIALRLEQYVSSDLVASNTGIVYCAQFKGYQHLNASGSRRDRHMLLDNQTMRSIIELVGLEGIRAIDTQFTKVLNTSVYAVKSFMERNARFLQDLPLAVNNDLDWRTAVKTMTDVQPFADAMIKIGHVLVIRQHLRELVAVMFGNAYAAATSVATLPARLSLASDPAFQTGRMLADDVSPSDAVDEQLLRVFKEFCATGSDVIQWSMLPSALSCLFLSRLWKDGTYSSDRQAYSNNIHVAVLASDELMRGFGHLVGTAREAAVPLAWSWVESFVKFGALHVMRAQAKGSPIQGIPLQPLLCLEQFVAKCPFANRSFLYTWVPYPLLHAIAIESSMGGRVNLDTFVSDARAMDNSPKPVSGGATGGPGASAAAGSSAAAGAPAASSRNLTVTSNPAAAASSRAIGAPASPSPVPPATAPAAPPPVLPVVSPRSPAPTPPTTSPTPQESETTGTNPMYAPGTPGWSPGSSQAPPEDAATPMTHDA